MAGGDNKYVKQFTWVIFVHNFSCDFSQKSIKCFTKIFSTKVWSNTTPNSQFSEDFKPIHREIIYTNYMRNPSYLIKISGEK